MAAKYIEPLMRKRFRAESAKEAQLKALRWLAKNVVSNPALTDVVYDIALEDDNGIKIAVLTLSVALQEDDVIVQHCRVCREFHKLFFINENANCNECKARAFSERMHDMLTVKKRAKREQLKQAIEQTEGEE